MNTNSIWRKISVLQLATALTLTCNASTNYRIAPLRTNVVYSAHSAGDPWSVPIKATNGQTIYILSLVPTIDVGGRIVGAELVLHHPKAGDRATNLFAPTGIWHGLQDYMFPALDLAQGITGATFGEKRTILVKRLGIAVHITVSNARVSESSGNVVQLDALDLEIEVDNSGP